MKYTLQAGRSILKDDLPFVHIVRSTVHSQGDYAYTPEEADMFAREVVAACNSAPVLTHIIMDAIRMLHWRSEPMTALMWSEWVAMATAALGEAKTP